MNLINRDTAIQMLDEYIKSFVGRIGGMGSGINGAREIIKSIPVEEPKTAEWIAVSAFEAFGGDQICWEIRKNPTAFHYCSNCEEQAFIDEFGDEVLSKYCPNCGAKMRRRII